MEENNKKIDELLEQNMSYGKIADLLGIDLIDVINYDNERIRTKRELQNIPANRKKAIKEMFLEDEMSVLEIADDLGISEKQVKEDLTMMGIDPKLPPALRKQLLENAKKRKNDVSKSKNTSKAETGGIIATRLKIANLLFEKGISENEIYRIFSDIPQDVIDWHIQYVKNHNITGYEGIDIPEVAKPEKDEKSVFGTRPNIIERRKAVYELTRKKKTSGEIASELGISIATVENDLVFLRKQGLIENKGTKQEQKERRQQDLKGLYGKLSIKQLAVNFGVSESTIIEDIRYLEKTGQLNNELPEETKKRRNAIPELRKKFYVSEIAKMFGVSRTTINTDIKWLKERGLIDETEEIRGRRSREKTKEIEERRENVASWYGKKEPEEMASLLDVSMPTVLRDIRFLIDNGIIKKNTEKPESEEIRERKRQLSKLYGKISYEKLAEKFGVSVFTIKRDVNDLVAKGIIKRKQDVKIDNRRAKVAKFYGKMNRRDMASKLGVSIETIQADINFLKKQGIIEEKPRVIVSLARKQEIEQRRDQIATIYNENRGKITVKEIATLLGISRSMAYKDIRTLRKEGRLKNFDEENVQEEEQAHDKRSPELEKRIKIIYQKIMSLYKEGKIDRAKELLRLLGERINFNDEERKKYDEIMAIFDKVLEKRARRQSESIESEDER